MKLSLLGALSSASGCIAAARWDVLSTCSRAWDWVLDKDTCISESGCTFAPGDDRWGAPSDAAKCLTCAMGSRARNRAAAACDGDALAGSHVPAAGGCLGLTCSGADLGVTRRRLHAAAAAGHFFCARACPMGHAWQVTPPLGRAMAAPGRGGNPFSLACGVGNMRKEAGTMEGAGRNERPTPPFLCRSIQAWHDRHRHGDSQRACQ